MPVRGNPLRRAWRMVEGHRPARREDYEQARRSACFRYSWAIPTPAAVDRIVQFAGEYVVEIGAGTGYWAALINRAGCPVVAYDIETPDSDSAGRRWHGGFRAFHPVQEGSASRAGDHPDGTLMLCWPPYGLPMAMDALRSYADAGGRRVVYIGEGLGGGTADDEFHAAVGFAGVPGLGRVVDVVPIPRWNVANDSVYLIDLGLRGLTR